MADLSKIKLNGVEYDLKDAIAREKIQVVPLTFKETITENEGTENEYTRELYTASKTYKEILDYTYENKLVILDIDSFWFYYQASNDRYPYDLHFPYININSGYAEYLTPYVPSGSSIGSLQDSGTTWEMKEGFIIPTLESMADVEDMLESLGLDTTTELTPAVVPAELDSAVAL